MLDRPCKYFAFSHSLVSGMGPKWQVGDPTRKCLSKDLADTKHQIIPRLTQRLGSKIEILTSLVNTVLVQPSGEH